MKTYLFLLSLTAALQAAESPPAVVLWPNVAPGSEGKNTPELVLMSASGEQRISNIHQPSITPYLPAKDEATYTINASSCSAFQITSPTWTPRW